MRVGLAHQLVCLLGGSIKRQRLVDAVLYAERQRVVAAINRGGRSVNEMLDLPVPSDLDHVEMAGKVRLKIGARVLYRIPHASLRAEMDDAVEVLALEGGVERDVIRKIDLLEHAGGRACEVQPVAPVSG
jgi:hypothetical protein